MVPPGCAGAVLSQVHAKSSARSPQTGVLSQESTARSPQPGVHSRESTARSPCQESWPPGCLLGPPGCLLGASWMPPGCFLDPKAHQDSSKSQNTTKSTKYMFQKSRGVFFLRSPKRRRQLRHRRTGLGDPLGMMELCKSTIIWTTICS